MSNYVMSPNPGKEISPESNLDQAGKEAVNPLLHNYYNQQHTQPTSPPPSHILHHDSQPGSNYFSELEVASVNHNSSPPPPAPLPAQPGSPPPQGPLSAQPSNHEPLYAGYGHPKPFLEQQQQSYSSEGTPGPYSRTTGTPYKYEVDHQEPPESGDNDKSGRILGLRRTTFFLILALVAVVIIAAVGGGVGGSIAVNNAKNSAVCSPTNTSGSPSGTSSSGSSATASSTTTSSVITVPTNGIVALDCPNIDTTNQLVSYGSHRFTFKMSCGYDFLTPKGANESVDIMSFVSYSLENCLRACGVYNVNHGDNSCVAAEFNQALDYTSGAGNCYLKNSKGMTADYQKNSNVGGELVQFT